MLLASLCRRSCANSKTRRSSYEKWSKFSLFDSIGHCNCRNRVTSDRFLSHALIAIFLMQLEYTGWKTLAVLANLRASKPGGSRGRPSRASHETAR